MIENGAKYRSFVSEESGLPKQVLSVEGALELVGDRGPYQYLLAGTMALMYAMVSFVFMSPTFFLADPRFSCPGRVGTFTEQNGGCAAGCTLVATHSTMTEQFGLYCARSSLRGVAIALMYGGVVVGNLLIGALGDRFGRRRTVLGSWACGCLGVLLIGLSNRLGALLFALALTGATLWPPLNVALILVNEQCAQRFRQVASLVIMLSFGLGEALLAVIVYYVTDWHACVLYVCLIPCLCLNAQALFLQDSPKFWLSSDPSRSLRLLNRIARINGRPPISEALHVLEGGGGAPQHHSYLDLFRYRSLRAVTLGACLLTLTLQVVYFGCQFALSAIGLNVYLNTVVAGLSQVVVLVPSMWLIPLLRRKRWLFACHAVSVLLAFSYLIVDNPTFQTVNAGLIKAANRVALSLFTLYVNEVYPTCVRSLGNGINFSVSQIGSVAAPLLVLLSEQLGTNAMFLVALVSLFGLLAYPLFRETYGQPLQNEIEEQRDVHASVASNRSSL